MKSCIKFSSNKWIIDIDNLKHQLKKSNIDIFDYPKVKKYIHKEILHNVFFLKYLVKKFKKVEIFNYIFDYQPDENEASCCLNINRDDFLCAYDKKIKHNFLVNRLYKKIIYYTDPKYIEKVILSKKIDDNLTYSDLIKFLTKNPNEFDIKQGDTILGYSGEEFWKLLIDAPLFLNHLSASILNKVRLNSQEWKNIKQNYNRIKYLYEVDSFKKSEFKTFRSIVDEFQLNPKLKKNIIEEIPKEFNKIQIAYFIYKRLCQKFSYDEEFYCLQAHPEKRDVSKHMDVKYLSTIEDKGVVICTGFSLIYAKFLDEFKIPFQILDYNNNPVEKLNNTHIMVHFKIGDYVVSADGAHFSEETDMASAKLNGTVRHFKILNNSGRIRDEFNNDLKIVDDYLKKFEENFEYKDAKEIYSNTMSKEYVDISVVERVNLLIEIICDLKVNFLDMFKYILSISKKILDYENNQSKVEFIINNTNSPKLNILIAYNEQKNIEESPLDNNYIVINSNGEKEEINYKELNSRFKNNIYSFTTGNRSFLGLNENGDENEKGKNIK